MSEQNKFRPFLIGIVDGSLTNDLSHELYKKLEGCPICTLSMSNYLKDGAENEANPESVDFELLLSDLLKLLNNEECTAPIYDFNTKKRSQETNKISFCQIIILEGLLCFYNNSIRNLMDLKIFIDTGNDVRFAETISKEIDKKNRNKKINSEMVDFWKKMIRLKGAGNFYDPHVINGWIIKFIPDLSGEQPKLFDEINEHFVPDQILSCPLKIIEDNSNGFKVEYNCDIASGFFGMIQDKKRLSVKPVIGYAFVVEEKKTSPMTREDKEEIIKNYFN